MKVTIDLSTAEMTLDDGNLSPMTVAAADVMAQGVAVWGPDILTLARAAAAVALTNDLDPFSLDRRAVARAPKARKA